jgi:hypothetical protein
MDTALFFSDFQNAKKIKKISQFFCTLPVLTEGIFASAFTGNKLLRSHKSVEDKDFLMFLLVDGRISIRAKNKGSGSGPGGPKT